MFNFGKKPKIVGFTNGCFDILHVGHIKLFEYLKNKSDKVIIGIDSDRRVKELKGPTRPINNEQDRKLMLESLSFVDEVIIFDSARELENLGEHAKKIEFFEKIDGYSTTKTIQRSSDR